MPEHNIVNKVTFLLMGTEGMPLPPSWPALAPSVIQQHLTASCARERQKLRVDNEVGVHPLR